MGHGFATLSGRARRALGWGTIVAALSWRLFADPSAAQTTDEPGEEEPSGTLLPPEGGISIVPTDEGRDRPETARTSPGDDDAGDGTDDRDVPAPALALAVAASLAATAVGFGRVRRSLHAWRSPASLAAAGFEPAAGPPTTSFSLLVLRDRGDPRLAATLDRLAELDHPSYEVLAVVAYDDLAGRGAAVAAASRHRWVRAHVDHQVRPGRAARLNAALDACRHEVVGVFGPGDDVHRRLLRHVDRTFADPEVGAVQGGVRQVVGDGRRRWFTARSVVDQYFWSRSRLPFHGHQRFTPLAGTTVFVRGQVLRDAGGWDERSEDEAAELGVRLSVRGVPVTVAYDPELATRTPVPRTLRSLFADHRARVRGTLEVLGRGVWRDLPTRRQRFRARAMLVRPLVEAVTTLAVAGAVVAAVALGAPPVLLALALVPALPVPIALGAELVGLAELARLDGGRTRLRDAVWLVLSFVPYQLVVSVAALVAFVDGRRGVDARQPSVPVAPAGRGRGRRSGRISRRRSDPLDDQRLGDPMDEAVLDLFTTEPVLDHAAQAAADAEAEAAAEAEAEAWWAARAVDVDR